MAEENRKALILWTKEQSGKCEGHKWEFCWNDWISVKEEWGHTWKSAVSHVNMRTLLLYVDWLNSWQATVWEWQSVSQQIFYQVPNLGHQRTTSGAGWGQVIICQIQCLLSWILKCKGCAAAYKDQVPELLIQNRWPSKVCWATGAESIQPKNSRRTY